MIHLAPCRISGLVKPIHRHYQRSVSTLRSNPNIYVFQHPVKPSSHVLSFLPTDPPTADLVIGETDSLPPENNPNSFRENSKFLHIMYSVLAEQSCHDPQVKGQAAAMASSSGATLMQPDRRATTGSAGASDQGGSGSASKGGFIHVSDNRHPPDFGRIADPEDIFGSLEVDGDGSFTDGYGRFQESHTYRVCTRDGVLQLPDFIRTKLVERLRVEESAIRNK